MAEVKHERASGYHLMIRLTVTTAKYARSVTGTLLGESKVNIATFHLDRDAPGGSAIALVQVDQPISPDLMVKIAGLESVVQAKLLSFQPFRASLVQVLSNVSTGNALPWTLR